MFKHLTSFFIFSWLDIIEISFFSSLIYLCSIWLKYDNNNLLMSFYAVLSILYLSNFAHMTTITNFLISSLPVFLVAFFLIHQRTLQKNFIALKKISSQKSDDPTDWVTEFMRIVFTAMNNNKQITCIIEGNNSLAGFIKNPFTIASPFHKDLIDILINSQFFDQKKMIWISYSGLLNGINSIWNPINHDYCVEKPINNTTDWHLEGLILTSKFDCILFRTYPAKRTIDIIIQGRLIEDTTPNNALNLIAQFSKKNEIKSTKINDRNSNEIKLKNNSFKQTYT